METNDTTWSYRVVKEEQDPDGLDQHDPGAKMDKFKPDMTLLIGFSSALRAVAMIGMYGMSKYTRDGWQQVKNGKHRYAAAQMRHIFDSGEEWDPESNMLHAAHAAWNALATLEMHLREHPSYLESMLGKLLRM